MSNHYPEIDGHNLSDFIHELPFYLGNIMKYAWRAPYKNGIDDTLKLLDYLSLARASWVEYKLSDRAIKCLSEIYSHDFYLGCYGLDSAHRRVIKSVAEIILDSDGRVSMDEESMKLLMISTSSLQVALLRK